MKRGTKISTFSLLSTFFAHFSIFIIMLAVSARAPAQDAQLNSVSVTLIQEAADGGDMQQPSSFASIIKATKKAKAVARKREISKQVEFFRDTLSQVQQDVLQIIEDEEKKLALEAKQRLEAEQQLEEEKKKKEQKDKGGSSLSKEPQYSDLPNATNNLNKQHKPKRVFGIKDVAAAFSIQIENNFHSALLRRDGNRKWRIAMRITLDVAGNVIDVLPQGSRRGIPDWFIREGIRTIKRGSPYKFSPDHYDVWKSSVIIFTW